MTAGGWGEGRAAHVPAVEEGRGEDGGRSVAESRTGCVLQVTYKIRHKSRML